MIVTVVPRSCTRLGMLSQVTYCIQDAAAAAMAAPCKFPEAKSIGLVDLFLLFSFPKGELKRFIGLFGLCWTTQKNAAGELSARNLQLCVLFSGK